MVYRAWLVVHALVTLAAGVVLVVAPGLIPSAVGIHVSGRDALLPAFLGAAEIALAVLSAGALRVHDPRAIRLVVVTFAVFHAMSAVVEVVWLASTGWHGTVAINVGLRVVATVLFLVLGFRESRRREREADAAR